MSKHRRKDVEIDTTPEVAESVDNALEDMVGRIVETKLGHFLDDIERRFSQTREMEAAMAASGRQSVFAEDLNILRHTIEGYTVTANSPGVGNIAWTNVHIMYAGVDYTIADGSTTTTGNKYVWFVKPGSYTPGTPVTLSQSNTKPTLATGDTYVFINNAGTPVSVIEGNGASAVVGPLSVDTGAIIDGAVIGTKILDGAVIDTKIGTGAVTGTKILDGAVVDTKIGTGAVTVTKILDGAVQSTKIADDAVTNAKIGPSAVGSTEVADDAITNAKIGPSAVNTTEIADNAVSGVKVADGAVGSTKIADGAVGNTKIANGGVLPSKLNILQHVMF